MDEQCTREGCERELYALEICQFHYNKQREAEAPECAEPGCTKRVRAKGLCQAHYVRLLKYGSTKTVHKSMLVSAGAYAWLLEAIRLDTNDCLRFPFRKSSDGYGVLQVEGKVWRAHRLALTLIAGEPPPKSPNALHCPRHCRHKDCVNPKHLRWGSQSDNMNDIKLVPA